MTYSRKRYWLAMAAMLAVVAAAIILRSWLRLAHTGLWVMPVGTICGALGLLAYFSRDEIERQNRMRAWYWGGGLAILFGVVPFTLIASNAMLAAMADFLPFPANMPDALRHAPKIYFSFGIMVTILAQVIGNYIARIALRFRS